MASISLFPHNESAYHSAVSMLQDSNAVAVIHPTGTGKSFIAFKLCEDNPDKRVLWLSPSEYIFRTQKENLVATGADVPENIEFCTYSKLMLMDDAALSTIKPDFIIQDEFHRIGAEKWGEGVERLLNGYPVAKTLGLSATNIRFLDGQRDMAQELYDGAVASEMTLGEAITRGILNAPRYVLTSFSLDSELKRYQSRIKRAKSAAVRDEGEKLLEALRRAIEKADGLDVVFRKHITDTAGKYLVFCANVEHMREMMAHVQEWFNGIDPDAHVYYAYSDDPSTSRAFRDFKADKSEHLKLLFTIDMLNEGIHVEDVSGVILFRPTVSPIIYKQQIGRALSAAKTTEPIIFDVVNNIENLYSIGAVEQEMRDAMFLLRERGDGEEIVVERFDVVDELRDCRELFARLDETLTVSWDLMFAYARQYFQEHGNLLVPRRYRTAEGYALGNWILIQRKVRSGKQYGKLDEDRIARLDSIGMVWEDMRELSWKQFYDALCRYKAQYGDIDIKSTYVDENGLALGACVANLRSARRDGRRSAFLTQEHVQQLDELGMIWDRLDYGWEQNYQACAKYYVEHGDLNIPASYVLDGYRIGNWIRRQRMLRDKRIEGVITPERIKRLDDIGMVWTDTFTSRWEYGYEQAKQWYEEHGNLNVPTTYVNDNGFPLGMWLKRQVPDENGNTQTKVTPEKEKKLDAIGMIWDRPEDSWEVRFALVKAYYEEHGDLKIPPQYKADGVWIAKWLNEQRQIYIGNRPGKQLAEDQIQRLEAIGMTWENRTHAAMKKAWQEQYEEAELYFRQHGDLKIPGDYRTASGKNLCIWIVKQRAMQKQGKLAPDQVKLLTEIGMEWELADPWEVGFSHAEQYFRDHGSLPTGGSYICEDGYRLGSWLSNQRFNHNNPSQYHSLTAEQANRLEAIGMNWSPKESRWMEGYRHAKAYLAELDGDSWQQTYVSPDGFKTGEWIRGQIRVFQRGGGNELNRARLAEIGIDVNSDKRSIRKVRTRRAKAGVVSEAV